MKTSQILNNEECKWLASVINTANVPQGTNANDPQVILTFIKDYKAFAKSDVDSGVSKSRVCHYIATIKTLNEFALRIEDALKQDAEEYKKLVDEFQSLL